MRQWHPEVTHFHWQDMQLTGEHRNEAMIRRRITFYEEGSYTTLVKLDCVATENQIYYYHAKQNGMLVILTDAEGRVSWQHQSQTLWGTVTANHNLNTDNRVSQPLRFAGQYFDNETGLHYNTFRYYDPQAGRFTQPDPIGLLGGFNLYQYAPNPLGWIDPIGWCLTRSDHALELHQQGRPVGQARNDLQNARTTDILRQVDDGRWVILGPKGRVHIIEPDGSVIVTSMNNISRSNVLNRIRSGRWEQLTQAGLDEFKDIFSNFIKF